MGIDAASYRAILHKFVFFARKDCKTALSYRMNVVLSAIGILFQIIIFYYISMALSPAASGIKGFNYDYFAFVLTGIAFSKYLSYGISGFSRVLSEQQASGTLEFMLVTGTGLFTILLASNAWGLAYTTFEVILYMLLGNLFFGLTFKSGGVFSFSVILALTLLVVSGIGMIAASLLLVFKKGDPIAMLFSGVSLIFGGVYFPINVLPEWLQKVSYLMPAYYSITGARHALLDGYSCSQLLPEITMLAAFAAVLMPAGLFSFHHAVKKAKADGTLTHF